MYNSMFCVLWFSFDNTPLYRGGIYDGKEVHAQFYADRPNPN